MTKRLPFILCLLFVASCANFYPTDTPRNQLAAAAQTYTALVESASSAVETGLLKPNTQELVLVQSAVNSAGAALNAASASLDAGQIDTFNLQMALVKSSLESLR